MREEEENFYDDIYADVYARYLYTTGIFLTEFSTSDRSIFPGFSDKKREKLKIAFISFLTRRTRRIIANFHLLSSYLILERNSRDLRPLQGLRARLPLVLDYVFPLPLLLSPRYSPRCCALSCAIIFESYRRSYRRPISIPRRDKNSRCPANIFYVLYRKKNSSDAFSCRPRSYRLSFSFLPSTFSFNPTANVAK